MLLKGFLSHVCELRKDVEVTPWYDPEMVTCSGQHDKAGILRTLVASSELGRIRSRLTGFLVSKGSNG